MQRDRGEWEGGVSTPRRHPRPGADLLPEVAAGSGSSDLSRGRRRPPGEGAEGKCNVTPTFFCWCVWGGGLTLAVREPSLDGAGSVGLGVHPAVPHRYLRASAHSMAALAIWMMSAYERPDLVLERLDQTHRAVQARVATVREFLIEPDAGTGPAVAGVAIVIPAVVPERGGGGGRKASAKASAQKRFTTHHASRTRIGPFLSFTRACSPRSSSSAPSSRARLACSSRSPSSQIALSLSLSLLLSSNARSSVCPPHPGSDWSEK